MISRLHSLGSKIGWVLSRPLIKLRLPPNLVSLSGILLALVYSCFVWRNNYLLAFPFGVAAVLIDLVDGPLARALDKVTNFGNYLEGIIDKTVDLILIGSFVSVHPVATMFAAGSSFLVSFAKPRVALVVITDNRHWPGVGERGDKIALLLLGVLVSHFQPSFFGVPTMKAVLVLLGVVSLVGLIQRIQYGGRLIEEAQEKNQLLPYILEGRER